MRKPVISRGKKFGFLAVMATVLLAATAAFAYFTTTGTGTGTGKTGSPTALTIKQIGAGYDSLVASNTYTQDQCFSCVGLTKLGDRVTLANPGTQELSTVVVAFRNWGPAITTLPIKFTIYTTVSTPISVTSKFDFPAATAPDSPSTTDSTFNFSSLGAFITHTFTYSITYPTRGGTPLNVALSNPTYDISVGSNATTGSIWVTSNVSPGAPLGNDFPGCSKAGTGFAKVTTECGPASPTNPGAYGTRTELHTTGNADTPAVEVNVVGGVVPTLFPGGPSQPVGFALVNKGQSPVHVDHITTTVTGDSKSTTGCSAGTYTISGSPATYGGSVQPGTTLFANPGTSVAMSTNGSNQDACEGATVSLGFHST
jgi:hypothetical protein